jgi:hypothetical protein
MVNGNITPLLNIICKISRNRREPLPSFRLRMKRQPAVEESGSFVDRVGTPFEWIASAHYNTEHPQVHVELRGIGAEGRPV